MPGEVDAEGLPDDQLTQVFSRKTPRMDAQSQELSFEKILARFRPQKREFSRIYYNFLDVDPIRHESNP